MRIQFALGAGCDDANKVRNGVYFTGVSHA